MSDDDTVIVCAACLTEACWDGYLMCDEARTAGIVEIPRPVDTDPEATP